MKQFWTVSMSLGLGLALALSCDREESIDTLVEESLDLLNTTVEFICRDCRGENESQSECQDRFGYVGPSRTRCYIDSYKRDESASRSYLECLEPLDNELAECIRERLNCDADGLAIGPCFEDFNLGTRSCIELPQTIQNGLDNC